MKKYLYLLIFIVLFHPIQAQYYDLSDVMKMALPMPANMVTATQEEETNFRLKLDSVIAHIEELQKNYKHPFISQNINDKQENICNANRDKIMDYLTNKFLTEKMNFSKKTITLETECWQKQQPLLEKLEQLTHKSSNVAQFEKEVALEKDISRQIYELKVEYARQKVEAYKSFVNQMKADIANLQPAVQLVDKTPHVRYLTTLTRSMALEVGRYYVEVASGTYDFNVKPPIN